MKDAAYNTIEDGGIIHAIITNNSTEWDGVRFFLANVQRQAIPLHVCVRYVSDGLEVEDVDTNNNTVYVKRKTVITHIGLRTLN